MRGKSDKNVNGNEGIDNSGPLRGVRILDMTSVIMGPYATLLLADMGADVIKIESPIGDISRQSTPARHPKMGHAFLNSNRNKRSVCLDLQNPLGRDAFLALVKTADALVYALRPASMKRLGLGYSDLKKVNPKLIYVGGFGFSENGPYAGRPAYDDIIQGNAAIPWLAAKASGKEPRYAPNAYADRVNALHISNAVLAALYHRNAPDKGRA